jgi:GT2 family glycosyltransferase
MTVYIIVVSYNGMKWIEACLSSCIDYKVIVVDNASQDDTVSYIRKNFPHIQLLEQKKNLGFGQANNKGISFALNAGADYVFLLNQDAYLKHDTIRKLIKVHNDNKEYGVVSPIHLNGQGTKLDKGFSDYLAYDNNNWFYFDAITNNLAEIYEVPFVNAAGWLLPQSTLLKIGGFDPIFFHYGEDANYCQRLSYQGLKVGVVSNAFMNHDREFTNRINENDIRRRDWLYKTNWANINLDVNIDNDIKEKIFQLKKSRFFSILKFNLSKVRFYNEELKLIYSITEGINKSRIINKRLGKHYIENVNR